MSDPQMYNTFETALEAAVEMENHEFRNYLKTIQKIKDKNAKTVLKEAARDELNHKFMLEKSLLAEAMLDDKTFGQTATTVNFSYLPPKKELSPGSTAKEVLIYAIHMEKNSVDFYERIIEGYGRSPMVGLFEILLADEKRHLQALEDVYEKYFMLEN
ncbi:MAG: ferritin family protein [Desulfuromonadales bacterium]|nr:ferritin family protein [Desulfuromonadales bacterium]